MTRRAKLHTDGNSYNIIAAGISAKNEYFAKVGGIKPAAAFVVAIAMGGPVLVLVPETGWAVPTTPAVNDDERVVRKKGCDAVGAAAGRVSVPAPDCTVPITPPVSDEDNVLRKNG